MMMHPSDPAEIRRRALDGVASMARSVEASLDNVRREAEAIHGPAHPTSALLEIAIIAVRDAARFNEGGA